MAEEGPSNPDGGSGSHENGGRSPRSPSSNVLGLDEDLFLPIANVRRIIKKGKVLPADAKIAKDAKQTYLECVSVFISFITSEASDKCRKDKRHTLNGDDLLWAMNRLGFQDYVNLLKAYLKKYREVNQIEGEYLRSIKDHDVRSIRKEGAHLQSNQGNSRSRSRSRCRSQSQSQSQGERIRSIKDHDGRSVRKEGAQLQPDQDNSQLQSQSQSVTQL